MIDDGEPRRWSSPHSEVPEELRALLGAGRARLPAASEVAELRQRLGQLLGPEASLVPAAPVASGASAQLRLLTRVAAVAGGVGTAALLGLWLSSTPPASEPPGTSSPAASEPAALVVPPAATEPPALAPTPAPVSADSAPPDAPTPAAEARPSARGSRGAPAASEAELLRRAQAALAERPQEALRLTAEHQRRFPRAALGEEREVIAIEALRQLGRETAAQRREAAFERRYRGSVHREKLRDSAR